MAKSTRATPRTSKRGRVEKSAAEAPPVAPAAAPVDFFISRRGASAAVAQEVAGALMEAGYTVLLQDYDIAHGANFVAAMHDALKRCRHFIALLTRDYDASPFTSAEWTNFYAAAAQSGGDRRFIALRVEDCVPGGLFSGVVFGDLVGVADPQERRARILSAAEGRSPALARRPKMFENLPPRDLNFTGHDDRLDELHALFTAIEHPATCVVIQGLGGVGKTSLAAEYAHRYASAYGGVWWAPAQERPLLAASLATLSSRVEPQLAGESDQEMTAKAGLAAIARSRFPLLLIYDNVETPRTLDGLVPAAGVRLLITTRWADWGGRAAVIKLDGLPGDIAAKFLQKRARRTDPAGAMKLAAALGGLPLALDHAGAYCRLTATSFEAYCEKIDARITRAPKGATYPASVAATFGLAIDELASEQPGTEALLGFFAYLATERIPLDLVTDDIVDEDAKGDALMALAAVSLIEHVCDDDAAGPSIALHRLVQAAMRAELAERGLAAASVERAVRRLTQAFPKDAHSDPKEWRRCAVLIPHVLALYGHLRAEWTSPQFGGNLLAAAASYLHGRGAYREAEPLAREAIAIAQKVHGREHPEVAHHLGNLADLLRDTGSYAEAEERYREAIAIGEKTLSRQHPQTVNLLNNLALLLWNSGRYVEAEPPAREAIGIIQTVLGEHHPAYAASVTNLANLLKYTGRLPEAEPLFRQAIGIAEKNFGHDHPDVIAASNNLGSLLRDTGRYAEAEALYRNALAIGERIFGREHPRFATSLSSLARLLGYAGRHQEGESLTREAIEIFAKTVGTHHPLIGRAQENLARILLESGRAREAVEAAEVALSVHEKSLRFENVWRRTSGATCADALAAVDRRAEAAALRRRYDLPVGRDTQPA